MVQVGDKGWMNEEDRFSDVYKKGVADFVDFTYSNRIKSSSLCPCRICRNKHSLSFPLVKCHLEVHSIDKSYVIWSLHGEKSTTLTPEVVQEHVEENVAENVDVEISVEEHIEDNTIDEQCGLGDFVDKAYGVFDGLDKDVDETDFPNLGKKYYKYKELAKEKIYPGYEGDETTLSVIVELQHIKKIFGWSGNSVTYLLGRLKKWFPEGNTFPEKYPTMKAMLIDLGMKDESIHACVNHCVLFRKEHENATVCPIYKQSRFVVKEGKDGPITTKEPRKVLRHFPLCKRIKRYYPISWIARYMKWHHEAQTSFEHMHHPVDSLQWQTMKKKWPEFAAEARNVWLGISTGGFNPRGIQSTGYSCWPVILVMYNLPPSLCMKEEFQIMSLLLPGPKAPGQDMCVSSALIDELRRLWIDGFTAFDMHLKEAFICRVVLMWSINDLPGYGNVSGCTTHGYKACPHCADETESIWMGHCRKIVYLNYLRFLKTRHPFRSGKYLGLKTAERIIAPHRLSGEEVMLKLKC